MSVDLATRTEELARDFMSFPKWVLASALAELKMETAHLRGYGNPALQRMRREAREQVAASARRLAAEDAAQRAEARRARVNAEAERKLKLAMKEAVDAGV